jgi:hypothetical protein
VPDEKDPYKNAYDRLDADEQRLASARNRHNRSSWSLARYATGVLVKYRERAVTDSDEHVGMVEELRLLDLAHGHPPTAPDAPTIEPTEEVTRDIEP